MLFELFIKRFVNSNCTSNSHTNHWVVTGAADERVGLLKIDYKKLMKKIEELQTKPKGLGHPEPFLCGRTIKKANRKEKAAVRHHKTTIDIYLRR